MSGAFSLRHLWAASECHQAAFPLFCRHPVQRTYRGRRLDRLRPRLQAWPRRHRLEAQGFRLPFGALARLAQNEKRKCTGREARSRGRLGQREMAITHGKSPFVFGMAVLATLLIAAPVAHAACKSPKNIHSIFDSASQTPPLRMHSAIASVASA
jgi:hypothetical protein